MSILVNSSTWNMETKQVGNLFIEVGCFRQRDQHVKSQYLEHLGLSLFGMAVGEGKAEVGSRSAERSDSKWPCLQFVAST